MTEEIGADRIGLMDPWSAPRRAVRRLLGRRTVKSVAYDVPPDA